MKNKTILALFFVLSFLQFTSATAADEAFKYECPEVADPTGDDDFKKFHTGMSKCFVNFERVQKHDDEAGFETLVSTIYKYKTLLKKIQSTGLPKLNDSNKTILKSSLFSLLEIEEKINSKEITYLIKQEKESGPIENQQKVTLLCNPKFGFLFENDTKHSQVFEAINLCLAYFNSQKKQDDVQGFESNVVNIHEMISALSLYLVKDANIDAVVKNRLEFKLVQLEEQEPLIHLEEIAYHKSENKIKLEIKEKNINLCLADLDRVTYKEISSFSKLQASNDVSLESKIDNDVAGVGGSNDLDQAKADKVLADKAFDDATKAFNLAHEAVQKVKQNIIEKKLDPKKDLTADKALEFVEHEKSLAKATLEKATVDKNYAEIVLQKTAEKEVIEKKEPDNRNRILAYKDRVKVYYDSCSVAINNSVKENSAPLLQSLRAAVSKSIEMLKTDESRLMTFYSVNPGTNEVALMNDLTDDIRHYVDRLSLLAGESSRLPLIANWQSKPFTHQFYAGLDINQVNNESAGNPRLGLLNYFRPGRKLQFIRESVQTCDHNSYLCGDFGPMWPHLYFSTTLTSAAEQTNGTDKPDSATEWEIGVFWPWYIGRRAGDKNFMTEFMIGPIYTRGGVLINNSSGFKDRQYPGLRLAFNEEMYFDIMWKGVSEGAKGRRNNFRGQFPVSELGSGRLFFGMDINFNSFSKKEENDDDSYKIYVMWQTSFDDLWSARSSAK